MHKISQGRYECVKNKYQLILKISFNLEKISMSTSNSYPLPLFLETIRIQIIFKVFESTIKHYLQTNGC